LAEECIFCQIIEGKLPANTVYEDEYVIAFKDIKPVAPIHVLIIPKKHISDLTAMKPEDKELIGHLNWVAVKIAEKLGLSERGFRLVNNCKEEGGQVVYHLHYHLLGGRQMRVLG